MSLSQAIRQRDVGLLPGRRQEDWRWTDIRGLVRSLPPAAPEGAAAPHPGRFGDLGDAEVLFVDGRLRAGDAQLRVGEGEESIVRLRFVAATAEVSHAARVQIEVARGASVTLLESYEGLAGGYLADVEIGVSLGAGARLRRYVLAEDAADSVMVSTATVDLAAGAGLDQFVLTCGARRQRIETRVAHPGAGAVVRLDGAYILSGQRHADQTSVVDHAGPDGVTEQLAKGVVTDQARAVFQGRIRVAHGADRVDARMGHHALLLSDRAEVDARPELEIYADDVSCAHGNTVGVLDEEALFYAMQRGIPEAEARALLVEAFVGESLERIGFEPGRDVLARIASGWLRG